MAKSRRKVRKAAKRPAKKRTAKRKSATKANRKPAKKKTRKAKPRKTRPRKQTSIVDTVTETVRETGELRERLAGPNTFED